MQIFPNQLARLVNGAGLVVKPWVQYFQQFTQAPPNATQQNVGTFIAVEPGFLYVKGASSVTLIRGTLKLDCSGAIFIPVSINDSVIVAGVKPYFFSIYGANTLT